MASSGSVRATASRSLHILLADDNEIVLAALRGMLQCFGHSVDVAVNGREAVTAAARRDYDLVILDVQMPEMGGFEAARALRLGETSRVPRRIVGISAESEDRNHFEAAGMDDFLAKPVRITDLAGVLSRFAVA